MEDNRAWSQLIAGNPRAALFPDDRNTTVLPVAITFTDGSQHFVVSYKVLDGCHACARLGTAFVAFEFSAKGKLTEMEFVNFYPASDGIPSQQVPVNAGERFTLALPAEPGREWTLAQEPARWILKSLDQNTDGGTVFWNFQTLGNGSTQMVLSDGSQDAAAAAATLPLRVIVAPGLGHGN